MFWISPPRILKMPTKLNNLPVSYECVIPWHAPQVQIVHVVAQLYVTSHGFWVWLRKSFILPTEHDSQPLISVHLIRSQGMLLLFAFQATQNPRWQAAQSRFFSGRHPYSGVFWGKLVLYIVAAGCIMLYPYMYTTLYMYLYIYILYS